MLAIGSYIRTAVTLSGWIVAGVLLIQIEGPLFIHGWREQVADLRTELSDMHRAAELAMAAQSTLDQATEARHSALAKDNADEYRQVVESARSAVSTFARDHPASRVCPPSGGSPGAGDASSLPTYPPAPADPGDPAAMVAITREDLDHLATGAMQASSSQRFFQSLIDEGAAIPIPEF